MQPRGGFKELAPSVRQGVWVSEGGRPPREHDIGEGRGGSCPHWPGASAACRAGSGLSLALRPTARPLHQRAAGVREFPGSVVVGGGDEGNPGEGRSQGVSRAGCSGLRGVSWPPGGVSAESRQGTRPSGRGAPMPLTDGGGPTAGARAAEEPEHPGSTNSLPGAPQLPQVVRPRGPSPHPHRGQL